MQNNNVLNRADVFKPYPGTSPDDLTKGSIGSLAAFAQARQSQNQPASNVRMLKPATLRDVHPAIGK